MSSRIREFQVFAKPAGAVCNLNCSYCYYLEKQNLFTRGESFIMPDDLLEKYIVQHIEATAGQVIFFSWHGGEPTVAGLDFYHRAIDLQKKYKPAGKRIINGIQTNGTLLSEEWCRFLASENFLVGISMDGPPELHDCNRMSKNGNPTHEETLRGYKILKKHGVICEILCVVSFVNGRYPLQVYRYFREIGAGYISFLPLVDPRPGSKTGVSESSVPPGLFGDFLCTIFDEWVNKDIGKVKIQILEEAARTAFGQEHTLCIFKPTCGGVPVVEHNGNFYSCDHFVDSDHLIGNIRGKTLAEMLDSPEQISFGQAKMDTLPQYCLKCGVRSMCNGECPKNRFILTPEGKEGLNYLCEGYKKFFHHCRPFVDEVARIWREKR